jgi:hypothetical protein
MSQRFNWVLAGLAVVLTASTTQAALLEYRLEAVSASSPGSVISPDGRTVTVPTGSSGYVQMNLYVSLKGNDLDPANDGFNGGTILMGSVPVAGTQKMRGNFGLVPPANQGAVKAPVNGPPYMQAWGTDALSNSKFDQVCYAQTTGFLGEGNYPGVPTDLNGDGDMDWGGTITANCFNPSVGKNPANNDAGGNPQLGGYISGDWVLGNGLLGADGRTNLFLGTVYFNYGGYHYTATKSGKTFVYDDTTSTPPGAGFATKVAAWSWNTDAKSTYFLLDSPYDNSRPAGVYYNPSESYSSLVAPFSPNDPGFGVTIQTEAVPEPATFALLGIGGLVLAPLAWRRRRG